MADQKYRLGSARIVKREGQTTTSTGGGQTTYKYQSRSVTTTSGGQPAQIKTTKYVKTSGGADYDDDLQDDVQEYQEEGNVEAEYGIEQNDDDLGDDLNQPEDGEVVTYQRRVVTTTSGTGGGSSSTQRVVTQNRSLKGSSSGSALIGNRRVETVTSSSRGTNPNKGVLKSGGSSGSNILQKNYNTTRAARNRDDRDYKFQRKKLDRGGNFNNIQVTHIIYSKKPAEFHITQNLHQDGLKSKPLDLDRLRKEGKLRGPSSGKSSFSCSCTNQRPLKREKICRSTAFIHCGGEGTKPIDLSNSSSNIVTTNLKTVKPSSGGSSSATKRITTTTTTTTTSRPAGSAQGKTTTTTTSKVSGTFQGKQKGGFSGAYSKMVKNVGKGVKNYGKK